LRNEITKSLNILEKISSDLDLLYSNFERAKIINIHLLTN